MPTFKYRVMNHQGEKIEEIFNANSKNEVLAMMLPAFDMTKTVQ